MLSAKTQPVYNLFGESLQATLHIGHSHEKHISLFIKLSVYTECCKYSLSTSAQLQLLDDKLLTLLLMPLQVDVIVGRWQIHRVTVNTSIQRLQPIIVYRRLLTLHFSVLPATTANCSYLHFVCAQSRHKSSYKLESEIYFLQSIKQQTLYANSQ